MRERAMAFTRVLLPLLLLSGFWDAVAGDSCAAKNLMASPDPNANPFVETEFVNDNKVMSLTALKEQGELNLFGKYNPEYRFFFPTPHSLNAPQHEGFVFILGCGKLDTNKYNNVQINTYNPGAGANAANECILSEWELSQLKSYERKQTANGAKFTYDMRSYTKLLQRGRSPVPHKAPVEFMNIDTLSTLNDADKALFTTFYQTVLTKGYDLSRIFYSKGRIFLSPDWYVDVSNAPSEAFKHNWKIKIVKYTPSDTDLFNADDCFNKENFYCTYDYGLQEEVQVEYPHPVQGIYNRFIFYRDDEGFKVDDFLGNRCVSKRSLRKNGHNVKVDMMIPLFYDKTVRAGLLAANPKLGSLNCPTQAGLDKFNDPANHGNDTVDRISDIDSDATCAPPGDGMLYAFIAVLVMAILLTIIFLILIILMCVAKKRMQAQGKKLPKKPWETQATEDGTTYMDQTVGVTEATTVGGETSAYTTVA